MEYQDTAVQVHDGLHDLAKMMYQLESQVDNDEASREAEIQKSELRRMAHTLADFMSYWKYSSQAHLLGY